MVEGIHVPFPDMAMYCFNLPRWTMSTSMVINPFLMNNTKPTSVRVGLNNVNGRLSCSVFFRFILVEHLLHTQNRNTQIVLFEYFLDQAILVQLILGKYHLHKQYILVVCTRLFSLHTCAEIPISSNHCSLESVLQLMIWQPASVEWRSNILTGCESPSIPQWYTVDSVTIPMVLTLIHFQNCTSSAMVCAFILLFISMLKICKVFPAERDTRNGKLEKENRCLKSSTIILIFVTEYRFVQFL